MGVTAFRSSRDFRLLWTAGLISALGSHMATVAMPLTVLAVTGSPATAGVVGSVSLFCTLVFAIPGGAVADAYERRGVMVACSAGAVLSSVGLATVLLLTSRPPLAVLIVLAAVTSVLASVQSPAVSALLVSVVPVDQLGAATGRLQARSAAARLAGPLIGGALYAVGRPVPFVALAVCEVLALCCALAIRSRSLPLRSDRPWFGGRELTRGLVFVWRHPELRTPLLLFGCVLNAAFGAAMLAAVAVSATADPSGRLNGIMAALAGGGSLLGALLAARLPIQARLRGMIVVTCWVATGSIALLAVTPPALLGVVFGVCMAVAALGNVTFTALLLRRAHRDLLGRVSSAAVVLSMIAQPIGPLAGGYLFEHLGAAVTFGVLALAALGCSVTAMAARSLRGVNDGPRESEPPARGAHRRVGRPGRRLATAKPNAPARNAAPRVRVGPGARHRASVH